MTYFEENPQFITITNLNGLPLLQRDEYKEIIIDAIIYRVKKKLVRIYAFVIMPNHMHLIWHLPKNDRYNSFQRDFLKFTARQILAKMKVNKDPFLNFLKVKSCDRKYQIWKRNSLSIELFNDQIFFQKMEYIHSNPTQTKWDLSFLPEQYRWSSASFYENGTSEFDFIAHYND